MRDRIQFYLREMLGFAYDEVNAVVAAGIDTLSDVAERVRAVHNVRPTTDFEPLAASFKRIQNISSNRHSSIHRPCSTRSNYSKPGPEQDLYDAFVAGREKVQTASADYRAKLETMASLRPQVDCFFDKILVNDARSCDPAEPPGGVARSLLTEFSPYRRLFRDRDKGRGGISI